MLSTCCVRVAALPYDSYAAMGTIVAASAQPARSVITQPPSPGEGCFDKISGTTAPTPPTRF